MNTLFTSGPWKADGYFVRQAGSNGTRMIADGCYTGPHHTPPDEYPKSCKLVDEANARLIASAPDLVAVLAACITDDAQGIVDRGNAVRRLDHITRMARYAIKLAQTGKSKDSPL